MLHCKLINQGAELLVAGSYTTAESNFGKEFASITLRIFSSQIIDLMLDTYSPTEKFEDWIGFAVNILECDTSGVMQFLKQAAKEDSDKYSKLLNFLKVLDEHSLINAISNHTIYAIEPYLLETLLEKIRERDFLDLPSRLESELAFCSAKDAREYLDSLKLMNADMGNLDLFELEIKDCNRVLEVDQNFLNKINFSDPIHVVLGCIHGYWSGNSTESPLREVILQGRVAVKSKLAV